MPLDVLVTGGSGYLGQFLLRRLASRENASLVSRLSYTFSANPLLESALSKLDVPVNGFYVDLLAKDGGRDAFSAAFAGSKDPSRLVVVNCAALAALAACEQDNSKTKSMNVPTALVDALERLIDGSLIPTDWPKIVHISTDQVYHGDLAWWLESDKPDPVNAYARSKLDAEELLLKRWPEGQHVSLRSSIIFGPQAPLEPVPRNLFVQFCDQMLGEGKPTTFFEDEWRCPIYAEDIADVVLSFLRGIAGVPDDRANGRPAAIWPVPQPAYNLGGPDRLSRVDVAKLVAGARKVPKETQDKVILSVPASSVRRPFESPLDISMIVDCLTKDTGVAPRRMDDVLGSVLGIEPFLSR